MTVGASNFAIGDFSLRLADTSGSRNIDMFQVTDVIKIQRNGSQIVSTINTSRLQFPFIDPVLDLLHACALNGPFSFPVPRLGNTRFALSFGLNRIIWGWRRRIVNTLTLLRTKSSTLTHRLKNRSANLALNIMQVCDSFRHATMLSFNINALVKEAMNR